MKRKAFSMKTGALCLLSLAGATAMPTNVLADDVTLRSQDGTINITGEFVEFTDNIYLVRTALGELRLSAERVRCEGDACPVFEEFKADVTLAGSDAVGVGMMPLMLEGYAGYLEAEATIVATEKQSEVVATLTGDSGYGEELASIQVSSTTSTNAFKALLQGEAEIGMASRRITAEEANILQTAGAGNMFSPSQEHIVGVDSLVVVTHPDNPIQNLSLEQLGKIYSGQIKNWSEVGGLDSKILVVDRPEGSGTRDVLADLFKASSVATISPLEVRIANDNSQAASIVRDNENAIGFVGYAFKRGTKPLTLVNECGIEMTPDAFSARTEEYSLQRRMYLYNRADLASEQASDLLDYFKSAEADVVIAKSGFIDLGIDRRAQTIETQRGRMLLEASGTAAENRAMNAMLGEMQNYDRLSTTFRFQTGSSQLDERAVIDMERLANYLDVQPAGTKVKIVGFTDSVGAFENNWSLARRRAGQVSDELATFAGNRLSNVEIEIDGYGEIAPSACNVSDSGRAINRRVEVWIEAAG